MDDRMRVLFDAYWWSSGPPSGRNVVRSMVRTWIEDHPRDQVTLMVRPAAVDDVQHELRELGLPAAVRPAPSYARIHALAAVASGRGHEPHDAVITQNFAARPRNAVSAVFVHDAMFAEHPEWFGRRERAYLSALRPSLRRADLVFTSSQTEANRISRVWPETAERTQAVGLHPPRDFEDTIDRRPATVGDAPYVLAVGRINVRKNLRRLVEAFLRDPLPSDHRLYVVGQPDGLRELLPDGDERVEMLDRVDDAELRWLYRHASLFVFPSLDEGFGLPLVEARSLGTPAVVSDIPVFRELGLADAYFDPESVDDIARTLADAHPRPPQGATADTGSWSDTVDAMRHAVCSAIREGRPRVTAA